MVNKIYIDWEDFGLLIERLVLKIKTSGKKYDYVCGIPRGGLPIAVALSHGLNIPLLSGSGDISSLTLIVDDINDTGETLKRYVENDIAVLYTTHWSPITPTYSVEEKNSKDDWIVFPWENYDTEEVKDNMEVIKC